MARFLVTLHPRPANGGATYAPLSQRHAGTYKVQEVSRVDQELAGQVSCQTDKAYCILGDEADGTSQLYSTKIPRDWMRDESRHVVLGTFAQPQPRSVSRAGLERRRQAKRGRTRR
jgi:hypothetical protein